MKYIFANLITNINIEILVIKINQLNTLLFAILLIKTDDLIN